MSPRATKRPLPPGLRMRGNTYAWEVRHPRLRGGRMILSLRTQELSVALSRMQAVQALMDRGDWPLVDRLRTGGVHITDVVGAIREGTVPSLRRSGHDLALLGDACDAFLMTVEATRSTRTHRAYSVIARQLVRRWGRDYHMEQLTVQEAEVFLHEPKGGKPWAPRRQGWQAVIAGAIWQSALDAEADRARRLEYTPSFTVNPWRSVQLPEVRQTRVVFLTGEEWTTLAAQVQGTPTAALLGLAFLGGLRVREILHLRTGVDVIMGAEPMVRVQSRGGEHPWQPKTRRGERDVPMSRALHAILQEHHDRGFVGDRYLLRTPGQDRPMSYSTARLWTMEAFAATGIRYGREGDGLTIHSGRHTFASWLAQDGVSLNIVAELLGDTMKTVEETYAHLVPDTLRAAVGRLDRMLEGV
jgi:integrase